MDKDVREALKAANETSVTLLFTDLELAQTMLERAELARDQETRRRNRDNVLTACRSIRHFMDKLNLTVDERRTLNEKLEALDARVEKLPL